jgi:hypothetical protein
MGGNNLPPNLASLTWREHMIAHLCLVKMHPGNHMLVKAATMMAVSSSVHRRSKNRIYGWLRAKHSVAMSISQYGSKNSQYGSVWMFNEIEQKNKKVRSADIDYYIAAGWHKGRIYDFANIYQTCEFCNKQFMSKIKSKHAQKNVTQHIPVNINYWQAEKRN